MKTGNIFDNYSPKLFAEPLMMEKQAHLEQLVKHIRTNMNFDSCFEELYERLEQEYYAETNRKEEERSNYYIDDLHRTMVVHAKKYIHSRTKQKFRLFVYYFLTDVETELFRVKKNT